MFVKRQLIVNSFASMISVQPTLFCLNCTTILTTGHVPQSVSCLAEDMHLTADPGVGSSFPAWFHTFVEIGHEIISAIILLHSVDSIRLWSVTNESMRTKNWLTA